MTSILLVFVCFFAFFMVQVFDILSRVQRAGAAMKRLNNKTVPDWGGGSRGESGWCYTMPILLVEPVFPSSR